MRGKKPSHRRIEVRVAATRALSDLWDITVHDRSGVLCKASCIDKSNVARIATQSASSRLRVPEGRIMISRVTYD